MAKGPSQREYEELTGGISAKEHYAIMRLAINKVAKKWLYDSYDVMHWLDNETDEEIIAKVWRRALSIAMALGYGALK